MKNPSLHYTDNHRKLHKFAIFIFVCILVLHGTYFRNRPVAAVPTMDWLVFAQLLTCATGFLVGIFLLPKNVSWGFGAKILLFYVLATGISAANSPYPVTVLGYFVLLLGASVLVLALVYNAGNVPQLEKIEKIWFFTVSALVAKDTLTSLFFMEQPQSSEEVVRLGMGVTHATALSFFAGLLFWMSFTSKRKRYPLILWLWRLFLLYVVIAAVSRVSIAAFAIGGLCYILFQKKDYLIRWILVLSCIGVAVSFFMLSLSFNQSWAQNSIDYLKRGQDKTGLSTFTGRTGIWRNAANKSLESPIIGHGYGVSRLIMEPLQDYQPLHCHNEVLEVFFTTGILGLIPFVTMFAYGLIWIIRSSRLSRTYSTTLTLHAICVVTMFFVSSLFEARIGGKLLPTHVLFFFYLLILDREKHFSNLRITVRN